MKLTDRERKLVLLAFDDAATPAEAASAFRALMVSLLGRYMDGYAFLKDLEPAEKTVYRERVIYKNNPFASYILGFGKYRGKELQEIPISYLQWVLTNFEDLWDDTREALEGYLGR